eukprot:TRINITY_DN46956_c0_g1_i1.p1 TRINITY_DN46956_c0_g1~~TRINITY_DN46956_c0_g1_i1.p1  ORF type:complete len:540 (-),score=141.06 TRINITY_DN46956_c0_g1_i1:251-1870(-)
MPSRPVSPHKARGSSMPESPTKKKGGGSAGGPEGLLGAVKLVVRTFIEEDHFRTLHGVLSDQWKSCHSLTAAIRLMEAHGVTITSEEEQRLKDLPEENMIDALVNKMPQQNQEQFEHFFLQLSLIASTTTRLREALEHGRPDQIEEALENAENVGIVSYLLKMAVVQGGSEVKAKNDEADNWRVHTQGRMEPLLQSQADNVKQQKLLAKAKASLGGQQMDAIERTKTFLLGFISSSEHSLMHASLIAWNVAVQNARKEEEIYRDYEERLQRATTRLAEHKSKQLANVRQMMTSYYSALQNETCSKVLSAFRDHAVASREARLATEEQKKLQAQLDEVSELKKATAKSFLGRMCSGNESMIKSIGFASFVAYREISKVEKQRESEMTKKNAEVSKFQIKCTGTQKGVIKRFLCSTDSGLLYGAFNNWVILTQDEKEVGVMKKAIDEQMDKLSSFAERNKNAAMTGMLRLAESLETGAIFVVFSEWKKDTRIERVKRYGKEKNAKRRQQLNGVKGLFKTFASELDMGLREPTPRVEPPAKK